MPTYIPGKAKLSRLMDSILFLGLLNNCCHPFSTVVFFIFNSKLPIYFHNLYPEEVANLGGIFKFLEWLIYLLDLFLFSWTGFTIWFLLLVLLFGSTTYICQPVFNKFQQKNPMCCFLGKIDEFKKLLIRQTF